MPGTDNFYFSKRGATRLSLCLRARDSCCEGSDVDSAARVEVSWFGMKLVLIGYLPIAPLLDGSAPFSVPYFSRWVSDIFFGQY